MNAPPLITLVQLAQWAQGDLVVHEAPRDPTAREALLASGVTGATLDSRAIEPGMLFVPLPGRNTDGHAFLDEAFANGAGAALCRRDVHARIASVPLGPLVLVGDVTVALQRIAGKLREFWPGLLVGVTGSSGKTTTKDLVAAAFATSAPTLRTEGNLNNHWGVPLTLLALRREHQIAVIEMAMNHPGEIAALAAFTRPSAAVITNAGSAHLEHMGSLEGIAKEKASLAFSLKAGAPAFVCADSPRLMAALQGAPAELVTYGLSEGAQVRPSRVEDRGGEGSRIELEGFPPVHLPLVGRHQVLNALAALAVARHYRLDPQRVADALAAARPAKGRMEVRRAQGATLLVDCYNANPDATRLALETLERWPGATRRLAVLGDMLELGEGAAELHRATAASARGVELWTVGAHARDYVEGAGTAGVPARGFTDKPALAAALREALAPGVVVLVKASRGAALEQVLEGLPWES